MKYYCPVCGETSEGDALDQVSPDAEIPFRCPHCETRWQIRIEFYPEEEA